MANFTLKRVDLFPSGTSVGAYKQSNWPTNIPASGAPQGTADATAVSDGVSIQFNGLQSETDYYAVAQVGGVYKYVAFRTSGAAGTVKGVTPVDIVGERRSLFTQASAAQTANGNSGPLDTSGVQAISVDVNVSALAGTTPAVQFFVDRLGADGVWYAIAQSASITAAGVWSTSVGPGAAANAELGDTIRLRWVITGTTPSITFSASVMGR